ncbi:MAG: alpha/beta hydrolase [Clostridia bacterium]|nr:alpha/beta hydrolase [Clostridia bacterium]
MELKLWENEIPYFTEGAETPNLMTTYFIETDKPLPCIVVYPGGGYAKRARHEAGPIAEFFNSRGMHAVVCEYRVAPNRHPAPLADAQRAIKILRANAEAWKIDPEKIVTLGFSAGGHLCASTITLPDVTRERIGADEIDKQCALPNGAILCYPVISVDTLYGHTGSGKNLLGEKYELEKEYFSLENRVSEKTPKAFLWHTSDDSCVNVKNSLIFGEKLRDAGIQFEMHIYPHGNHGLGLAEKFEDVSGWANLAADWVWRNI